MEVSRVGLDGFRVEITGDDYAKLSVISADKSLTIVSALVFVIERGLIELTGEIIREDE